MFNYSKLWKVWTNFAQEEIKDERLKLVEKTNNTPFLLY